MTNVTEQTGVTTEATLAQMWRELIGVEAIEPTDDFFDLGGTSLTAIKFLQRVEKAYGPDVLTPDTLYEVRTLDGITDAIDAALAAR
jgi:acyl carrier protein